MKCKGWLYQSWRKFNFVIFFSSCLIFHIIFWDRLVFWDNYWFYNNITMVCKIYDFFWLKMLKIRLSPFKNFLFICFIESPSKMMKNAFYFILKVLFVLKIFKFLSWLFGDVEKIAFKIHDFTTWLRNNCNKHIAQYLVK